MIKWIMYWFIEPFKPSFTKEIKVINLKKKFFISCKWGILVFGFSRIPPQYFLIMIPNLFGAYFISFEAFVYYMFIHYLIPLVSLHNSIILLEIWYVIICLSIFLSYPIGRRVGMYIYRDIYENHAIKGLPDEPWESILCKKIKNLRKK